MVTFKWNIDPGLYFYNLSQRQVQAIKHDVVKMIEGYVDPAQAWMQENARWTDRTGDARAALYADLLQVAEESASLLLSHGPMIDYSWYLETMRNGRYSILGDAVDHFAPVLYRAVEAIIRKHSS